VKYFLGVVNISMNEQAKVWIFGYQEQKMAVALPELIAVIHHPKLYELPYANTWNHQFSFWQNNIIPIIDINLRVKKKENYNKTKGVEESNILCIMAYLNHNNMISYGGFLSHTYPYDIHISNAMQHPLPPPQEAWKKMSYSCFMHDGDVIPIVNISKIFI
jgi:chemotaxis signal transduction protein